MIDLGSFRNTVKAGVTHVSAYYTHSLPYSSVMVSADADICLKIGDAATASDFFLPAGEFVKIKLDAGATLNYVLAESSSGSIYITECA